MLHTLQAATLVEEDPAKPGFWARVASRVPGKSPGACFARHYAGHPTPAAAAKPQGAKRYRAAAQAAPKPSASIAAAAGAYAHPLVWTCAVGKPVARQSAAARWFILPQTLVGGDWGRLMSRSLSAAIARWPTRCLLAHLRSSAQLGHEGSAASNRKGRCCCAKGVLLERRCWAQAPTCCHPQVGQGDAVASASGRTHWRHRGPCNPGQSHLFWLIAWDGLDLPRASVYLPDPCFHDVSVSRLESLRSCCLPACPRPCCVLPRQQAVAMCRRPARRDQGASGLRSTRRGCLQSSWLQWNARSVLTGGQHSRSRLCGLAANMNVW